MKEVQELQLDQIRVDGGTQARAELDADYIKELAELVKDGKEFKDNPVVYFDKENYWLADGFHRRAGTKLAGKTSMVCEVRSGTCRDARFHACGANSEHGLRRTNRDKINAVKMLLADPDWGERSSVWIADHAGVSHTFVDKVRSSAAAPGAKAGKRKGRDNKARATKSKKRQPGDEPKPGKNGQVAFNFPKFESDFGKVSRSVVDLAAAYGDKKSAEYQRCNELLSNFLTVFKAWKKRLTSGKKDSAA